MKGPLGSLDRVVEISHFRVRGRQGIQCHRILVFLQLAGSFGKVQRFRPITKFGIRLCS